MKKLKIVEHMSLDGVIQVTGDDGDFPYGDWTAPYRTAAGRDEIIAAHGGSFDLLLGRRTYDAWSGFWPKAPSSPMADGINAATKYIATHRPESLRSLKSMVDVSLVAYGKLGRWATLRLIYDCASYIGKYINRGFNIDPHCAVRHPSRRQLFFHERGF